MNNQVTVSISFCFKGQTHCPSVVLNVDQYMKKGGHFPNLYPLIAKENNFDLYSYEFEMMQAETILFSQAQGEIQHHIKEGRLDKVTFEKAWHEEKLASVFNAIIQRNMGLETIEEITGLKKSLFEIYQLAQES